MRWLWHTWRVMYHSIHDWNWSWNHWTSRQPALGPWRQLGGQGIGCSQLPAVAAAVRGEPEFKFSSGRSCTVVQCVHLYSPRTRPGLSGTVQCAGAGTGAGSDQSGYSERGEHTASVTVSVTTVLLQSERESPALGSVHQLAPEPSVRACALCVHRNWKWKFLKETFALIVTEDQVKLRLLLTAKHISNSISEERRFPNS